MVNVLEALWADGTTLLGRGRRGLPEAGARRGGARASCAGSIETGVSPAWTTAADEELTRRAFGDGHAIFLRNWPYAIDCSSGRARRCAARWRSRRCPAARAARAGAGSTGGSHSACSRRTRHPELAVALARFLTSERAQRAMALGAAL